MSRSTVVIGTNAPTDISKQSTRLARVVDRLPDGEYIIRITKRSRLDSWTMLVYDDPDGLTFEVEPIRNMDLRR